MLALGLTHQAISKRVAAGRWHREHHGVLFVGHRASTPLGRLMGAVMACGPEALAGGVTALVVRRLLDGRCA